MKSSRCSAISSAEGLRRDEEAGGDLVSQRGRLHAAVKAIQSRKGLREGYASLEEPGSWDKRITPD